MSDTPKDYQAATDFLQDNVFLPVFWNKLATDYGISPSTQEEATDYLALAGRLEEIENIHAEKQAREKQSLAAKANASLDQVFVGLGRVSKSAQVAKTAADFEVEQAASQLAQHKSVRDAALLFQDAYRQVANQK